MGDAEIDEGNVHEALLEYWKHGLENCWWIIDYNRQSLDSVVSDRLFMKMAGLFENLGWKVVLLKYGKLLQRAFAEPGGQRLKQWIDDCPNMLYSALVFQGGEAWRRQLEHDLAIHPDTLAIVRRHDDAALARLMTNLGGHDLRGDPGGVRRTRRPTSRCASSPTPSRASACPSRATRTTTPA